MLMQITNPEELRITQQKKLKNHLQILDHFGY